MPRDYQHIRLEEHGDLALVRVDRPPANAMDIELLQESHALLEELTADPPAGVVLTGRDGFFSAGVDLKLAPALGPEEQRAMVDGINRMFFGWYGFPRPVVCAVSGHAIAGGFILALCGDHRVGAREGKLGLTELRVGIGYPAVAMAAVQAELSAAAARRLALHAGLVNPREALALGALDELADHPVERALDVANELAALPTGAYERVKLQLRGPTLDLMERAMADDPMLGSWLSEETGGAAAGILGARRRR